MSSIEKAREQHVYVWEEEWTVFTEMSLLEKGLCTARLRLGKVGGCSRDDVDGESHGYQLPLAESSENVQT